jgi:hypothetical protein
MRFDQPVIYGTSYKGKLYIGQHVGNGRDYVGGGNIIKDIIKSGKREKLITGVIEYVDDVQKLSEREIYWIKKLNPKLNLAPGGEGGDRSFSFTPKILKSKSEKMKAIVRSKEWCDNIRKSKLGVKLSEEHKNSIRQKHIGKKISEETRKKLSYTNSAKARGKQYIKNLSKAIKLSWIKRKSEVI